MVCGASQTLFVKLYVNLYDNYLFIKIYKIMLGIVTTLSTQGTTGYQPTDSEIQLQPSNEYIINSLNIVSMKVFSTNDSDLRYKLNRHEDQQPQFLLRVNETNAAVQAIADVAAASNMILLNVKEGALSFAEAATLSSTAKYYNIDDISWIEENNAANASRMVVQEGGQDLDIIFVDSSLAAIYDLLTTGTTTSTTSTTSTTAA